MSKTEYIISESQEKIRARIQEMKALSIPAQRILYFKGPQILQYTQTEITEDDEKIVVVRKMRQAGFGNNGIFERTSSKDGLTYRKKGRRSSRLTLWYGGKYFQMKQEVETLMKYMNNEIGIALLNNEIFSREHVRMTPGLLSTIVAGGIDSLNGIMKYHATYSLRGIKIAKEYREQALYEYYKQCKNSYLGQIGLRYAYDVNKLLSYFHPLWGDEFKQGLVMGRINKCWQEKDFMNAVNPTIAWADVDDDFLNQIINRCRSLMSLVGLMDQGPVIKVAVPASKTRIDQNLVFQEDLPF
jgi:hypothetical protein